MSHVNGRLVRGRWLAAEPLAVSLQEPGTYALWEAGELRPFWFTCALSSLGLTCDDIDTVMPGTGDVVASVAAGRVYPSWPFVCRFMAALGLPLSSIATDTPPPFPASGAEWSDHIDAVLAASYHPAVVAAIVTVPWRDGFAFTADVHAAVNAAEQEATRAAATAALRQAGMDELADGIATTEDPIAGLILGNYAPRIHQFQQELFNLRSDLHDTLTTLRNTVAGTAHDQDLVNAFLAQRLRIPTLEARALTIRDLQYRFVGDMTEDLCTGDTVITLTAAATDLANGRAIPAPDGVLRWIPILLGPSWAADANDLGVHSPTIDGAPHLRYFTLRLPTTT